MTERAKIAVQCCDCDATTLARPAKDGSAKTPLGWRKTHGGYRCKKCQAAQFMGRSIRLRIIGPHESEDRDRATMYEALYEASRESNQFANWYLQRLLAADAVLVDQIGGLPKTAAGKPKLPPAPQVDWYADATRLFSRVAPQSLCQQAQMVKRYYDRERFAALVAMTRNVRSYRWDGLPVVVSAQAWKLVRVESGKIVLRAQIGPGKSWTLDVFAQGADLQRMRQIADGEVIPGAAMFVRRARAPRPGESKRVRVWYLRVSAQVPRPAKRKPRGLTERTLTLGFDSESLLYGTIEGLDEPFIYPGYELRKSIVKFERLDRRRQIDNSLHFEGWSRRKAKRWAQDRTAACDKRLAKIKAELALCAATLVRVCQRHDVTAVDFDTTPRGFLDTFPYAALKERIKTSLENAGIAVHLLGGTETQVAFARPGSETEVQA